MADLHKAEADLREALSQSKKATYAEDDKWTELERKAEGMLAALEAARGEAVATVRTDYSSGTAAHAFGSTRIEFHGDTPPRDGTKLYAAPPAALAGAATRTLTFLGYTYHGGEHWKPPLGQAPQPAAERSECKATPCVVPADAWIKLYRRAVDVANGLTNYVEERPELRDAARRALDAIQRDARAMLARIAELSATNAELRAYLDGAEGACASAQSEATALRARIAELEAALAGCVDLAEWWINHKRESRMCERDYMTWLSLGHRSNSLLRAKAAIDAARKA